MLSGKPSLTLDPASVAQLTEFVATASDFTDRGLFSGSISGAAGARNQFVWGRANQICIRGLAQSGLSSVLEIPVDFSSLIDPSYWGAEADKKQVMQHLIDAMGTPRQVYGIPATDG